MRILHVTESLGGGVLTSLRNLALAQVEEGHRVTVWYTVGRDTPAKNVIHESFGASVKLSRVETTDGPDRMAALLALRRGIRRSSSCFDVIHAHSSFAGAALRTLPRRRGAPVRIYSPHGFYFLNKNQRRPKRAMYWLAEYALSLLGDATMAVSNSEAAAIPRKASMRRVIPNGVPLSEYQPVAYGTNRRLMVCTTGRVCEQKAPWRFAELASKFRDIDFVWIGDGEEADIGRWLGSSNVRVTGWRTASEVRALVSSADLFVLASLWEGMPMALIEAQALGVPSLVTDVPGNVDVVIDDVTGVIAKPGASFEIAFQALVGDEPRRTSMAAEARGTVRERLSSAEMGQRSLQLYEEVLQGRA